MTLRELCVSTGASRRSIQGYESLGLLKPTNKNKYGHLQYDEKAFQRAKMIKFMQELGFKLKEIQEIIDAPIGVRREAFEERVNELNKESAKLENIIKEAMEYIDSLKD